jgi:hypothetical protein
MKAFVWLSFSALVLLSHGAWAVMYEPRPGSGTPTVANPNSTSKSCLITKVKALGGNPCKGLKMLKSCEQVWGQKFQVNKRSDCIKMASDVVKNACGKCTRGGEISYQFNGGSTKKIPFSEDPNCQLPVPMCAAPIDPVME